MHSPLKKSINKGIFTAFIAVAMALAPFGAGAATQQEGVVENVEDAEVLVNVEAPEVEKDHTPLALQTPEVFDVQVPESKVARRMTQAEKNQNAAENDGWGGAITIIAMCIVISALVVLSILFMIFGKISEYILTKKKKKAKAAASHAPTDDHALASGEVIAAISMALAEHFAEGHDVEDTILTIRRLQKAYSPWNSKIYNLRLSQEHKRNPSTEINFHESKRIQI